jgi:hypothetical protein
MDVSWSEAKRAETNVIARSDDRATTIAIDDRATSIATTTPATTQCTDASRLILTTA